LWRCELLHGVKGIKKKLIGAKKGAREKRGKGKGTWAAVGGRTGNRPLYKKGGGHHQTSANVGAQIRRGAKSRKGHKMWFVDLLKGRQARDWEGGGLLDQKKF